MAMSAVDFANKINWEGGLIGALEYGLCSTDLADDETELIEARLYDPDAIGPSKWLVGDCGSGVNHPIYPEEIGAYIELFNAMKNYKKED